MRAVQCWHQSQAGTPVAAAGTGLVRAQSPQLAAEAQLQPHTLGFLIERDPFPWSLKLLLSPSTFLGSVCQVLPFLGAGPLDLHGLAERTKSSKRTGKNERQQVLRAMSSCSTARYSKLPSDCATSCALAVCHGQHSRQCAEPAASGGEGYLC